MLSRVIGARHRRPLRVPIEGHAVTCALTRRRQAVRACARCPFLQGSLEGLEASILCGAPARRPPIRRRRRPRLFFDTDWPDEPD
jgi:hypothetical protein